MRFMILRKADGNAEAGVMPSEQPLADMMKYSEDRRDAGRRRAAPSAKRARVKFSNGRPTVVDGPFTETQDLISGCTSGAAER